MPSSISRSLDGVTYPGLITTPIALKKYYPWCKILQYYPAPVAPLSIDGDSLGKTSSDHDLGSPCSESVEFLSDTVRMMSMRVNESADWILNAFTFKTASTETWGFHCPPPVGSTADTFLLLVVLGVFFDSFPRFKLGCTLVFLFSMSPMLWFLKAPGSTVKGFFSTKVSLFRFRTYTHQIRASGFQT